jgi:hypothetical protein
MKLIAIPFLDVRDGGPVAHARARAAAAAALRDACLGVARPLGDLCLPPIDRVTADWLRRSASPYRPELEEVAALLGFPGALTLNMAYLYACTTQAYEDAAGRPRLRRSLDWAFPGLGKAVEIAWQAGSAGDFYNVTWPGAVGVLTAVAPGRFCAAINQAPMARRIRSRLGFPYDAAVNLRRALAREGAWPPDHLLRYAFESCETFEDAVALVASAPVARPALFTFAGMKSGELALIERTEKEARLFRGPVVVANDWQEPRPGWRARTGEVSNGARRAAMRAVTPEAPRFSWVRAPVLNKLTRLAVEMSAAEPDLAARGYECGYLFGAPRAVTEDFELAEARPEAVAAWRETSRRAAGPRRGAGDR